MNHLENTTYIKHLRRAWSVSATLLVSAIVGIVHGVLPFVFKTYVSSRIEGLNKKFTAE